MKQKVKLFGFLLLVSLGFGGCENDLEVNGEWKETMVVFGLLNGQEQEHYIKISKAFLGEGNAFKYASIYDSIYYKPDQLEVKIDEFLNGDLSKSYSLEADSSLFKEPGTFSNPGQLVYRFKSGPSNLNPEAEYRLSIKNKKSQQVITGKTKVFGNLSFEMPGTSLDVLPNQKLTARWKSVKDGALYEALVRFTFREVYEKNPQDTLKKYVEFNLGRLNLDFKQALQPLSLQLDCINIYRTLGNELGKFDPQNPVTRLADSLLLRVNVVDEDLQTYLSVNQPSNTLAQERPEFSNVQNGIGLFASRGSYLKKFYIRNQSVDSLRSNIYTKNLNFKPRD